jgi:hypothetical protein
LTSLRYATSIIQYLYGSEAFPTRRRLWISSSAWSGWAGCS